MILSNIEIQKALDSGRLVIDPEPTPRTLTPGAYCPYDTHAVDLRLGPEIAIPPDKVSFNWDLMAGGKISDFMDQICVTKELDGELRPETAPIHFGSNT